MNECCRCKAPLASEEEIMDGAEASSAFKAMGTSRLKCRFDSEIEDLCITGGYFSNWDLFAFFFTQEECFEGEICESCLDDFLMGLNRPVKAIWQLEDKSPKTVFQFSEKELKESIGEHRGGHGYMNMR
jgi:hypothetical protein